MTLRELESIETQPGYNLYPLTESVQHDERKIVVLFWNGEEKECVIRNGMLVSTNNLEIVPKTAPNVRSFRQVG